MEIEVRETSGGVRLRLRVGPGGRKDAILGPYGGALKVTVSAPPEKGKANQAVLRLLARSLSIPSGALLLVSGSASRNKVVEITGMDATELVEKLHHIVQGQSTHQ